MGAEAAVIVTVVVCAVLGSAVDIAATVVGTQNEQTLVPPLNASD